MSLKMDQMKSQSPISTVSHCETPATIIIISVALLALYDSEGLVAPGLLSLVV